MKQNTLVGTRRNQSRDALAKKIIREARGSVVRTRIKSTTTAARRRISGGREAPGAPTRSIPSQYWREFATRPCVLLEDLSPTLRELVYDDMIDAYMNELALRHKFVETLMAVAEKAAGAPRRSAEFEDWRTELIAVKLDFLPEPLSLQRDELIWLLTSIKDPRLRESILQRGFVVDRTDTLVPGTEPLADAAGTSVRDVRLAFLRALKGAAASNEQAVADAMVDAFTGPVRSAVNAAWKEVFGREAGTGRSGVPHRISPDYVDGTPPWQDPLLQLAGHRDERLGAWAEGGSDGKPQAPIRIGAALPSYFARVSQAAKTSAYLAPVYNIQMILGKAEVKHVVKERIGEPGLQRIWDAIEKQCIVRVDLSPFERAIRRWLRNFGVGILGLRVSPILLNIAGIPLAIARYPGAMRSLVRAFARLVSDFRRVWAAASKHSPYWRERYEVDYMWEMTAGMAGGIQMFGRRPLGERIGMTPLQKADEVGGVFRWLAAESLIKRENPRLREYGTEFYRLVGRRWTQMMFDSENSSHGMDQTGAIALGKRNPLIAAYVMFTSPATKLYSAFVEAVDAAKRNNRAHTRRMLWAVGLSVFLATSIRMTFTLDFLNSDERRPVAVAERMTREAAGTLPILGPVIDPILRYSLGSGGTFVYPIAVTDDFIRDAQRTVMSGQRAIRVAFAGTLDSDGRGEWRDVTARTAIGVAELAGVSYGFPVSGPLSLYRDIRGAFEEPSLRSRLRVERSDISQENRLLLRAVQNMDHGEFREAVLALREKRGPSQTTLTQLRGVVNRRYGHLTRYEPGKPDRARLDEQTRREVDSGLAERQRMRDRLNALARENSDIITPARRR